MTIPGRPSNPARHAFLAALCAAAASACAVQAEQPIAAAVAVAPSAAGQEVRQERAPYSSTYAAPHQGAPVLIRNATVLTGTGARIDGGDVLFEVGRIAAVGRNLTFPAGATVIDAAGRWVTPGLIDVHSHLGVYPTPQVRAHSDGNEATDPVTAGVWAEHSLWPQDPGFQRALEEGGITTLQILPGSANLIGGRGVTVKNVWAPTYQEMKFPGAPQGLKMACGENPKRVYGGRQRAPSTRMGNVAGYRQAFADARDYMEQWKEYEAKLAVYEKGAKPDATPPKPPKRDLRLESLAAAMKGELLVHNHCYRADEMAIMLDLAKEFGFRITAFHHGIEAYKIAGRLAEEGVCGALWADWWGFKLEGWDSVQENIAMVDAPPGGCAIVHSDSSEGIQRLNQEAAKAMTRGVRAGFDIPPERAIRWVTSNAAKALGILDQTGTLEAGKMADVVLWNGTPFSVYALPDLVFIDGALKYDRAHPAATPRSDFER